MQITHIELHNWRNFKKTGVDLPNRVFIAGANASGKSNFLDAFRFLKDLADIGLEKSISNRGGITKIKCLHARSSPAIELKAVFSEGSTIWKYEISITQEPRGQRRPIISKEYVHKNDKVVLERPDEVDNKDPDQKTQTALEQISRNADFRGLAKFLKEISDLHIIPQVIRPPELFPWQGNGSDQFGWTLIKNISSAFPSTQKKRLSIIEEALSNIVPNLTNLNLTEPDSEGKRHLEVRFQHWRPRGARQNELEFSDGTLRLIGLFWALLEGKGLLLMEEPELYLHPSIIRKIPQLIHRLQKRADNRQVMISTHSPDLLLKSNGVAPEEILLLKQGAEATDIKTMNSIDELGPLLLSGMDYDEITTQYTEPESIEQLDLFINKV